MSSIQGVPSSVKYLRRISIKFICHASNEWPPLAFGQFGPASAGGGTNPSSPPKEDARSTIAEEVEILSWLGVDIAFGGQGSRWPCRAGGEEATRQHLAAEQAKEGRRLDVEGFEQKSRSNPLVTSSHPNQERPLLDVRSESAPKFASTPPDDDSVDRPKTEDVTSRKRRRRAGEIPRDIARRVYGCKVEGCPSKFARPSALLVSPAFAISASSELII